MRKFQLILSGYAKALFISAHGFRGLDLGNGCGVFQFYVKDGNAEKIVAAVPMEKVVVIAEQGAIENQSKSAS